MILKEKIGGQTQSKTKQKEEDESMRVDIRQRFCHGSLENAKDQTCYRCLNCENNKVCRVCHEKLEGGDQVLAEKMKKRSCDFDNHILQRFSAKDQNS